MMAGWLVKASLVLWLLLDKRFSGIFPWKGQRADGVWAARRRCSASLGLAAAECGAADAADKDCGMYTYTSVIGGQEQKRGAAACSRRGSWAAGRERSGRLELLLEGIDQKAAARAASKLS